MSAWQQLVQTGILGTQRQPFQPPASAELTAIWQAAAGSDAEQRFLQAAAILTQYEAAGGELAPPLAFPATNPAPAEVLAPPPIGAVRLLEGFLTDFDARLVGEWLEHGAARGYYAPHSLLPQLLERASKERTLAAALAPVLGERGNWLLRYNPAWQSSAAAGLDERVWQTGNSEARVRFLATLRQTDPQQARETLAAVWSQEAAAERAALLATLRTGLTAADITFLESALSDRSPNVRLEAVRLLAALPNSALRTRLLTAVGSYLKLERRWLQRKLSVKLPPTFAQEWNQWGLREQSPLGVRIGQKAGWLVQLVALLPPSALVEALGVDAVELFTLIRESDYAEALLTALLEGAENQQDYTFLLAELRHLVRLIELAQMQQSEFVERFARYAPILPQAERAALLQQYLQITRVHAFGDWATLQLAVRAFTRLSPAHTTQLLTVQLPTLLQRNTRDYGIGRILLDLAYQLDPAGYGQATVLFQRGVGEERPDYVDRFLYIYGLRHQMQKEFS